MKVKNLPFYIAIIFYPMLGSCSTSLGVARTKVTVKIIDESGAPVKGVNVGFTFGWGFAEGNTRRAQRRWLETGETGILSMEMDAPQSDGTIIARKDGYYESYVQYPFGTAGKKKDVHFPWTLRWEPWNPTFEVVLKKIEKPVPMVVKMVDKEIDLNMLGSKIGFDLEMGDFVKPYGVGKVPDFIFSPTGKFQGWKNIDEGLGIEFNNPLDGIQPMVFNEKDYSQYKYSLKTAPDGNYENGWIFSREIRGGEKKRTGKNEKQGFLFKIRSSSDGKSAMYGKIREGFGFGYRFAGVTYVGSEMRVRDPKAFTIKFTYYLNPTGGRELEFDMKNNLADESGSHQVVNDP